MWVELANSSRLRASSLHRCRNRSWNSASAVEFLGPQSTLPTHVLRTNCPTCETYHLVWDLGVRGKRPKPVFDTKPSLFFHSTEHNCSRTTTHNARYIKYMRILMTTPLYVPLPQLKKRMRKTKCTCLDLQTTVSGTWHSTTEKKLGQNHNTSTFTGITLVGIHINLLCWVRFRVTTLWNISHLIW